MRLDRFIAKSRIIDLKSTNYEDALRELLEVSGFKSKDKRSVDRVLKEIVDRERTITTCLGGGVGLPHLRLALEGRPYLFAVGRCPDGLDFEGAQEYKDLRVIFLFLASDKEKTYLNVLASLARIFQDGVSLERMLHAPDLDAFREQVMLAMGGALTRLRQKGNRFNHLILKEAEKIARGAHCSAVLIFSDTFTDGVDIRHFFDEHKVVLVSQKATDVVYSKAGASSHIQVRAFSNNRLAQLRSAIVVGLTRGIFKYNDRLCCVGGLPNTNQFDSLIVVDVQNEFQAIFNEKTNILPGSVKAEVLERVLMIATELSVEGREGKPVGCLFVLGDAKELSRFMKPLVLNPFYGYKEEDRNILNPFMDETVKEFSSIDGAFVIRGDGVIESAGTMIHAPDYYHQLPGGLGTRHSAGMAISLASECISIVVSASTGQVSMFRKGQMVQLIEKSGSNRR